MILGQWRGLQAWGGCLVGVVLLVGGCAGSPTPDRFAGMYQAYERGAYDQAYDEAVRLERAATGYQRDQAVYMAGLAAQRLGRRQDALFYLQEAARSDDRKLAGDATASLGLLYAEMGQYALSARMLLDAAQMLEGQDRANAFFYAAISQQKLGRQAQARTNLWLAHGASRDSDFRRRVLDQLTVTGYTLQVGAFHNRENAQRAAEQLAQRTTEFRLSAPRLIDGTDSSGQRTTFVQVGNFSTFESARRARERLGVTGAIIVPLAAAP